MGRGRAPLLRFLQVPTHLAKVKSCLTEREYSGLTPALALDAGITAIYQEFNLIPFLSVSENIYFGRELMKQGFLDYEQMNENTKKMFKEIGMAINPKISCSETGDCTAAAGGNRKGYLKECKIDYHG